MLKTVSSITNAIGALNYVGTWNASTNTPTITSSVGTKGDYYQVSVAGSTTVNGISNWGVGDMIAFNGSTWQRIEGGADGNFVNLTATGQAEVGKLYSGIAYNPGRRINTQAGAGETAAYIGGANAYALIDNIGSGNSYFNATGFQEFTGPLGGVLALNCATRLVNMGGYGAGTATFDAAGNISSVSDETWKIKDGVPSDPVGMLKAIEPGYWYYNEEKREIFNKDRQLGFYAQNIHAAIGPEAAPTPEEGKPWGYYDRSVLAVAVMALQDALKRIETLESEISKLKGV